MTAQIIPFVCRRELELERRLREQPIDAVLEYYLRELEATLREQQSEVRPCDRS